MNVFSLFPDYSEKLVKIAKELDTEDAVFAFDADMDGVDGMGVGDVFENLENDQLYKVAAIERDGDQFVVQATQEFKLSPEEFNGLMEKLSNMDDAERRHSIGDALLTFTFKQVAPEYAHGVSAFEGMGKWYA